MYQSEDERFDAIFDSYCKTVIRNSGRNIRKRHMRWLKNEISFDFSSISFLNEVLQTDDFPSNQLLIEYKGKKYPIADVELYEKLIQLPFAQLEVLILKYWCGQTDQQIAVEKGVSARTVRNQRSRALSTLRARWKGE